MSPISSYARRLACCMVTVLAIQTSASAQITTFFGDDNPRGSLTNSFTARNNFIGAFSLTGTDNLESYSGFQAPPQQLPPPPTLNFGAPTAATGTTNTFYVANDSAIGNFYSVSGSQFLVNNFFADNVITLSRPVNGFGLFFTQVGDQVPNQLTLELFSFQTLVTKSIPVNASGNGTGAPLTLGPGRGDNSTFFFGISDTDAFDQVTIKGLFNNGADGHLYDDISIGFITGVPEPSTYALLGGLGIILYGRQKYQQRKAKKLANGC